MVLCQSFVKYYIQRLIDIKINSTPKSCSSNDQILNTADKSHTLVLLNQVRLLCSEHFQNWVHMKNGPLHIYAHFCKIIIATCKQEPNYLQMVTSFLWWSNKPYLGIKTHSGSRCYMPGMKALRNINATSEQSWAEKYNQCNREVSESSRLWGHSIAEFKLSFSLACYLSSNYI